MIKYTIKHASLYFNILADNDKEAIRLARQSIQQTSMGGKKPYLNVKLDCGAFNARLYIDPGEISIKNICNREVQEEVHF